VPASRSRTEHWRRSLEQIQERGGALEISLPRYFSGGAPAGSANDPVAGNLIWRVRILEVTDQEIVVEQPSALGHTIRLNDGVELVGVIAIGQNRWMFRTHNLGRKPVRVGASRDIVGLRLRMPETVERCQRRSFYRISTVGLVLPHVDAWPVLSPGSLLAAETASQARIGMYEEKGTVAPIDLQSDEMVLPEVGPKFGSTLMNIGGGGVGLMLEPGVTQGLESSRLFWLQMNLRPYVPAPLGVAARLAHTHRDSEQRVYAGLAFDFDHNPAHKEFVVDRLCRCVNLMQREQLVPRDASEDNGSLSGGSLRRTA
jgi:c-di-GMP-binding flagellar brake protein YcgR